MNTPTTPVNNIHASSGQRFESPASAAHPIAGASSAAAAAMRNSHLSKIDCTVSNSRPICDDSDDMDCTHHTDPGHMSEASYSLSKRRIRPDQGVGVDFDYDGAVRASYYGRRLYPSFDPSHVQACPLRFVKQFEHTAQHNGLPMKAWAKRFNSCLHGRAEDWAFDECPLELSGTSWDARKRQFLDWALLPAEQELRRQRLLRFYQTEADLSIDFVYSFEEAALGLRDYKENVWVRKCIANLLPPLRSALFELWPEGLPVRFRDLRDSLYAADWSLYEAASVPLKVVKCWNPYVYETYSQSMHQHSHIDSRLNSPSGERQQQQAQPQSQPHPHPHPHSQSQLQSQPQPQPQQPQTHQSTTASFHLPATTGANFQHAPPPAPSPALTATKKKRGALSSMIVGQHRSSVNNTSGSAALSPPPSADNPTAEKALRQAAYNTAAPATTAGSTSAVAATAAAVSSGIPELMNTLSRMSEKERTIIMVALERMSLLDESTANEDETTAARGTASKSGNRLARAPSLASRPPPSSHGHTSRAAAAAVVAATAQIACMESSMRFSANSSTDSSPGQARVTPIAAASATTSGRSSDAEEKILPASGRRRTKSITRPSGDYSNSSSNGVAGATSAGKIRLRTRPVTSVVHSRRQSSPLLDSSDSGRNNTSSDSSSSERMAGANRTNAVTAGGGDSVADARRAGSPHQLTSRRSDSALTTATRSMRVAGDVFHRESADDNAIQSPEFTVLHPADAGQPPNSRRGRFAFIKKISHMLSH